MIIIGTVERMIVVVYTSLQGHIFYFLYSKCEVRPRMSLCMPNALLAYSCLIFFSEVDKSDVSIHRTNDQTKEEACSHSYLEGVCHDRDESIHIAYFQKLKSFKQRFYVAFIITICYGSYCTRLLYKVFNSCVYVI